MYAAMVPGTVGTGFIDVDVMAQHTGLDPAIATERTLTAGARACICVRLWCRVEGVAGRGEDGVRAMRVAKPMAFFIFYTAAAGTGIISTGLFHGLVTI